jgi:hypothetical protein
MTTNFNKNIIALILTLENSLLQKNSENENIQSIRKIYERRLRQPPHNRNLITNVNLQHQPISLSTRTRIKQSLGMKLLNKNITQINNGSNC